MIKIEKLKFKYKGNFYTSAVAVAKFITQEANRYIPLNNRNVDSIIKHDNSCVLNPIILYYDYLIHLEYFDTLQQKYVSVIKYPLEYYVSLSKKNNNLQKCKILRYNNNTIYTSYKDIWNSFSDDIKKYMPFVKFRNIMQFHKKSVDLDSEECLQLLNNIETFDIVTKEWKPYNNEVKKRVIIRPSGYTTPARKRNSTRFDKFLYTKGIFDNRNINLDYINELLMNSIKQRDVETFLDLTHDCILRRLDVSTYQPAFEDEPEEIALFYTNYYYERAFIHNRDLKTFKNFSRWCLMIGGINPNINSYLDSKYYQVPFEEDYLNKSFMFDADIDNKVKELSCVGTYSFTLQEEHFEIIDSDKLADTIIEYSLMPLPLISNNVKKELNKIISNNDFSSDNQIVLYLLNQFRILFKYADNKYYLNLDIVEDRERQLKAKRNLEEIFSTVTS